MHAGLPCFAKQGRLKLIVPRRPSPSCASYMGRPRLSRILPWACLVVVALVIALWPPSHRKNPPLSTPRAAARAIPSRSMRIRKTASDNVQHEQKRAHTAAKAAHVYRSDGLLEVNPKGRHPILELIERSQTKWDRKVARQSKTLRQAVEEYKRRYGRPPPKGFEIWWDFVDFHGVQLVDEYDSINARMGPFWGVDPRRLRALQSEWEAHEDMYTIGKVDGGGVALLNDTMHGQPMGIERARQQIAILEDVQEHLPNFRATFTMHDGPAQFVSWEMRRRAESAAAAGEFIDVKSVAASVTATGWAAACPPDAPIHTYSPAPPADKKYFIHNHRLSMDPCLHPSHFALNGLLSQFGKGPNPHEELVPTFSICASSLHNDILAAAPEQFEDNVGSDPAWEDKTDERLLWRGSNTGIRHEEGSEWNISQRVRLVEMATRRGGIARVLTPHDDDEAPAGHGDDYKTSMLNAAFMDVAFVGKPIQCRGSVCDTLERMFEWRAFQSWNDAWQYKYIVDVDGNGWSARFKRLMTSNSLIFKSTIFPEWYTERIMPWVHYIPIQNDLSDLYDALMFFRGDLAGMGAHDHLARKIAAAGKKWSERFYRREDLTAYHFRLFLEYARVMSDDRESMNYEEK